MKRDDATQAQVLAADPNASTWLSANAGSGKTRVLTDRVALLLLQGVKPEKILCLTYTKAAAAEMQNRLFSRLSSWSMMADDALAQSLQALNLEKFAPDAQTLRAARRLFARAIETPGGLKIQTIHSFCASLLRRFPLEAKVSPGFVEMEERESQAMFRRVLDEIAENHPTIFARFAPQLPSDAPESILLEILSKEDLFFPRVTEAQLRTDLGLRNDLTAHTLLGEVFLGEEAECIAQMLPALREGSSTDQGLAKSLELLDFNTPDLALLERLEPLFLMGAKSKTPFAPKNTPPTKATAQKMGSLFDEFCAFRERVADARADRIALGVLDQTIALHDFARVFLTMVNAEKERHGWLSFDDQILKARALLENPAVSAWVLYRLDGGIDHILVDEAQDTAPQQWDVVRNLASEFTSGASARSDVERTLFVVGDQKQSIYSFQGADPAGFERMRTYFGEALERIGKSLHRRELLYSFRSSSAILAAVDATFPQSRRSGMGDRVAHLAFKNLQPGRVDLWNWEEPSEKSEEKEWYDPVDTIGEDHHNVRLARKIAAFIHTQLAEGRLAIEKPSAQGPQLETRPVRAGDFLILVQRRSTLFHEIIRACKELSLPLAGADRLRVGAELGVRDLVALLSYLATPEDDLSLATVLRSPMGGLSEDDLFRLSYNRKGVPLRARLEEQKEAFPEIYGALRDLRDNADFLRPYELLERALVRHGFREKLLARLGAEAEDGIEALLDQALVYESHEVSSLTGFLAWQERAEIDIKRQFGADADQIRVMTVHGAKGLEAPIVILPDTAASVARRRGAIVEVEGRGQKLARSGQMPPAQETAVEKMRAKDEEERNRLLYVAMTRAENWLIVCGAGQPPKPDSNAWYVAVREALTSLGAVQTDQGLRYQTGEWPKMDGNPLPVEGRGVADKRAPLPQWAKVAAPAPLPRPKLIAPSDLGGAKALAGEPADGVEIPSLDARERGTAIHVLLEHCPKYPREEWGIVARRLLPDLEAEIRDLFLQQIERLLSDETLKEVFAPDTLAEVPVMAPVIGDGDGAIIKGAIDRLIVRPDHVIAVDFKTNRVVPKSPDEVPEGLLRQMGAYHQALTQIYPSRDIRVAILWTATGELMPLPALSG